MQRNERRAGARPTSSGASDRRYARTPSGTINNCAAANGEVESSCQVCGGFCPERLAAENLTRKLTTDEEHVMRGAIAAGWRPRPDPSAMTGVGPGDEVEVSWGQATYTPVKFCTFTTGPFSARTTVREGETAEQARGRLLGFLRRTADEAFEEQLRTFLARVEEAAREADRAAERSRGR